MKKLDDLMNVLKDIKLAKTIEDSDGNIYKLKNIKTKDQIIKSYVNIQNNNLANIEKYYDENGDFCGMKIVSYVLPFPYEIIN